MASSDTVRADTARAVPDPGQGGDDGVALLLPAAALARLKYYLWDSDLIYDYFNTRNGMLGGDYSTKFAPWWAGDPGGCACGLKRSLPVDQSTPLPPLNTHAHTPPPASTLDVTRMQHE